MINFTFWYKSALRLMLIGFLLFVSSFGDSLEEIIFLKDIFDKHYDAKQDIDRIKSYELNVTNNGFCRYKRNYVNGKTEYFAFKLARFKDLEYVGSQNQGRLILHTKSDDVIVQTHRDKSGDVDTMATFMVLPIKNIEPEDLNKIKMSLIKISNTPQ